jgi:hypothetical protein
MGRRVRRTAWRRRRPPHEPTLGFYDGNERLRTRTNRKLAEGVGFEPTRERNPLLVFKTSALNHSAILPWRPGPSSAGRRWGSSQMSGRLCHRGVIAGRDQPSSRRSRRGLAASTPGASECRPCHQTDSERPGTMPCEIARGGQIGIHDWLNETVFFLLYLAHHSGRVPFCRSNGTIIRRCTARIW